MAGKGMDLKDALKRLLDNQPQLEVTKLPAEDPKPKKGDFAAITSADWPEHLYCDSERYPWLSNVKPGDEVILIVKAKVDSITTNETEKDKPRTTGTLTLLEVGKWGAK